MKIQSPGSGTTGYANERPGRRTANAQCRLPEYKRRTEFLTGNMNHLPAPCSKLLSHPGLPLSALLGLTWLAPCPAVGYVGPGAGFALAGGLWTALVVGIAALTLMILPLRLLLIWWRRKKTVARPVTTCGQHSPKSGSTGTIQSWFCWLRGHSSHWRPRRDRGVSPVRG